MNADFNGEGNSDHQLRVFISATFRGMHTERNQTTW
jgi:hypothetical protein